METAFAPDPPRCLQCGYVLTGLSAGNCPECGKPFDLADSTTFSIQPLFVRWKFWLPGFVLATFVGILLYTGLVLLAGWGVAVTIVAPLALGILVGYGCRTGPFLLVLLGIGALIIVVMTLYTLQFVGIFCGSVVAVVALGPMLLGVGAGALLRNLLKQTGFEQRWYLPSLLLLISVGVLGFIERITHTRYAVESVVTSVEIPASAGRTWNALMFYEEVRQPPPWLLRWGLPRPLYTRGSVQHVGDCKTCVYSKGHLTKRVTERSLDRRLAFDIIQQEKIENHSIRLTDGSFDFTPDGPNQTRVDLTTRYEPKLGPRWIWRPAERLAVHTLHHHVLEGMRLKVAREANGNGDAQ